MIRFLKIKKQFGGKLVAIPALFLCILLFPASSVKAQDLPDLSGLELPSEDDSVSSDSTMPPLPPGPAGPEDDIFGLDQDFEFEKTPEQLQEEVRSQAFEAALQGLMPLRPEEVRILLERFDRTQESVETPIYPPPKPLMTVETLTMDPGTQPTVIKTGLGHITVVNFIDITGKPWPVKSTSWAGDFEIMESSVGEDEFENVLRITPQNEYARGNMSVSLVGLQTPVIMILETNKDEVHYRFDATIPDQGPLAETPIIDKGITLAAGRSDMSGLLQGMVPNSAQKLNVAGVDGRTSAYSYNGLTYLRTPLTLLSPGWKNSATSADGMHVYEIQNTPIVLLSDKGKMVRAQLSDREELLDE